MNEIGHALDLYLAARFGVSLERVLADATAGVASLALGVAVEIVCDPVASFAYEDGGLSEQYQAMLTVEGVTYRLRCSVFTDGGGARFIESIGEPEVVRWGVRLVVPGRAAER